MNKTRYTYTYSRLFASISQYCSQLKGFAIFAIAIHILVEMLVSTKAQGYVYH